MPASDVTITRGGDPWIAHLTYAEARGGTRRERAASIGAALRGRGLVRVAVSHSETYGFLTATHATYAPACPVCGEPTRPLRGADEAARWGGTSAHRDGEPLCPVMGPSGYVPADHPSVTSG